MYKSIKRAYAPIVLVSLSSMSGLTGCATSQQQAAQTPTPDENIVKIIEAIKTEPSAIRGGGMIYELFVGTRFNAKFNDQSGELTLTDLESNATCLYDASGTLEVPEEAGKNYARDCAHLSTNTYQFINE